MSGRARSGPRVLGVTGGIGSGKSTLCRILHERHLVPVLDADRLGHDALHEGTSVYESILARFGEAARGTDRALSRPYLARVVFDDPRARRDLEQIVHPWILERIAARVAALRASEYDGILLLEAALLLDWIEPRIPSRTAGAGHAVRGIAEDEFVIDGIVVVVAPLERRLERLERRGMSRDDASARIGAQPADANWRAAADWVIENNGSRGALEAAAERLWEDVRTSWSGDSS